MFIDPLLAMTVPFDRCKSFSCRRRLRLIVKSQDILSEELDVFPLLNKINETYHMLKNFKDTEQSIILKYQKNRAIDLTETDDSDQSSSSDSQADVDSEIKKAMKASILKNMQLRKKERLKIKSQPDLKPTISAPVTPEAR